MKAIGLLLSHLLMLAFGFAAGIYALPILIAPDNPSSGEVQQVVQNARFSGEFRRDLADSDFLHWGEGQVSISSDVVSFQGELAPGPDYKLYLSPQFVETEADFNRLKSSMIKVGEIKTFSRFMVPLDSAIDPAQYTTVIIWCETFGQFITAAQYQ
ncbi:DM13 domain-containing protein [Photobacterium chitinilyticum]|uniref:DM13 domain-containing protein n=1 Tax=Photobacterium chitinilyticum TaxID=2485123 RepID=UPI0018F05339|nr:DM13 domain-containing protein [Photobacterium chitinilyticum]